jgi:hypothetical protein
MKMFCKPLNVAVINTTARMGKKNIRMETCGELTEERPRIIWLGDVCNDMKMLRMKNWN